MTITKAELSKRLKRMAGLLPPMENWHSFPKKCFASSIDIFIRKIVISTETQWNGEIYLEIDLAALSTSWFSTSLHPIAIGSARNDDIAIEDLFLTSTKFSITITKKGLRFSAVCFTHPAKNPKPSTFPPSTLLRNDLF